MQPEEPGSQLPPAFAASTGWQAMVFVGVVTVILGLIISLHPSGSLNVIAVLIGVLLVISGIFNLVRVFDSSEPHRVWLGIAGLVVWVASNARSSRAGSSRPVLASTSAPWV